MNYGRFDSVAREFVIERADTPTPWINYLGDGNYGGIISNTAGGYSFDRDPKYRRLLRYRYNSLPCDRPGRYLYIAEPDGSFWAPAWAPVLRPLDFYECRHGLGYTTITGERDGLRATGQFFVPPGARLEAWRWRLTNRRKTSVDLRTFCYAEFCPYDADNDLTNLDWTQQITQGWCEDNTIFYTTHMRTTGITFLHSSKKPMGFDCDREAFIGRNRDEANPLAVERGMPFGSIAYRGNGIGSFAHQFAILPGETIEIVFLLGIADCEEGVAESVSQYSNAQALDSAFEKMREQWNRRLSCFSADTPDATLSEVVNTWNPYQCMTTFHWARFVSLYECGIRRGIGFRDSCQDTLGVVHSEPGSVGGRLAQLLANQFARGDAYHQYFPFTGKGDRTGYSDDHLWAVQAVTSYIKETGDFGFTDREVAYAEGGSASIYDHLCRAVQFSLGNTGPHGVPCLGFADWNDALNLPNEPYPAESVLVGWLLCRALIEMERLARLLERTEDARQFGVGYMEMASVLNRVAWDGGWYLAAWKGDGTPVGSHENEAGQIYLYPQSWAVISGAAHPDRAEQCLQAAWDRLGTPMGLKLLDPPYPSYDKSIGGCTTYPPGAKENGGIFVHTNPWAIIAETMQGHGDRAFELYRRIAPPSHLPDADRFAVEPYVFCQNILGPDHPRNGLGSNSWLTGAAAWAYVAATQYILGIRPDYDRLRVEPCIPREWDGFRAVRQFRGTTFHIDVLNPHHVSSGVRELALDGKPVPFIPPIIDGKTHRITALMGNEVPRMNRPAGTDSV